MYTFRQLKSSPRWKCRGLTFREQHQRADTRLFPRDASVPQKVQFNCRIGLSTEHPRCDGAFGCGDAEGNINNQTQTSLPGAFRESKTGEGDEEGSKANENRPQEMKIVLASVWSTFCRPVSCRFFGKQIL